MTISLRVKDIFGLLVSLLGATVLLATMWLIAAHKLEETTIQVILTISALALVMLGMYVVVPKEAEAAVKGLGEAGTKFSPFAFRRSSDPQPTAAPTTVVVPDGQTNVEVHSPSGTTTMIPAEDGQPDWRDADRETGHEPATEERRSIADVTPEPVTKRRATPRMSAANAAPLTGRRGYTPGEG